MSTNPSLAASPRVEDWIAVRTDGVVEVRSGKVEIGQWITTAVALVAARELGVPFDRIAMVPPRTGVSPDEGYTSGSNSMEQSGEAVRLAAATARRELIARAALRLGVDPATLEIHEGLVRSRGDEPHASFRRAGGRRTPRARHRPRRAASPGPAARAGALRTHRAARPAGAGDGHPAVRPRSPSRRHAACPGRPPAVLPRCPGGASRRHRGEARGRPARARRQLPCGGGRRRAPGDTGGGARGRGRPVEPGARTGRSAAVGSCSSPTGGRAFRCGSAGRAKSRCPSRRRTGPVRSARSTSAPTRCTPRSRRRPRSRTLRTAR